MMLVTGASGFVGSAVLRRLIEAGERVRALVRPTSERRNLDGIDVEIVEGDLSLPKTLRAGLDGCKGLYHVAADYRLWTREPRKMLDTNVDGTRAIMLAAAEAGVGAAAGPEGARGAEGQAAGGAREAILKAR